VENVRYKEYLRDIHESGTHLLCLINDILDVAKAEAGKIELIEESVDIERTLESCIRLIQDRALQAGVAVIMDMKPNLPGLWADQRKIRQIILNLLSNSIKFTPHGGRIIVTATVDAEKGMILTVTDTGIGIAAQDIPKVLSPFGQVDSSLSRKHEGTGLGLPLSKALVEAHGGTLLLESQVGKGTHVVVAFPITRLRPPAFSVVSTGT